MKRLGTFLAVSLLFLTTAYSHAEQEMNCLKTKCAQSNNCSFVNSECTQQFLKGFGAGAAAGAVVNLLLPSFKEFTKNWNIHDNTGICRDQLAGQATVTAAALGISGLSTSHYSKFKLMGAQLVGIIVGACAASYAMKLLTTPAADTIIPE